MIYCIVGHRGAGKTSFINKLKVIYSKYDKPGLFLDLDSEIEFTTGLSIREIFEQEGESEFRKVEQETLNFYCCWSGVFGFLPRECKNYLFTKRDR